MWTATATSCFLSDVLGTDENQVGQRLEQDAERAVLRQSVARLSDRERQIMELRFGLVDGVERTQKEAGRRHRHQPEL